MKITTFNPLIFTKDANGFHVVITQMNKVEEDRCSIRMNVDNYEEAVKLLGERGFKSYQNLGAVETSSSTVNIMKFPSGFSINVSEHKK